LEEGHDRYFPNFYFSEAMYDNPTGSVVLDHYGVDPQSGEEWEIGECKRVESDGVRVFQEKIKARLHLNESSPKNSIGLRPRRGATAIKWIQKTVRQTKDRLHNRRFSRNNEHR